MRKPVSKLLRFFFVLSIVVINYPLPSRAADEMKLVYFHNYPPFSWENKNHEMEGILIDVLNEALRVRMGIPVIHAGYPWKRAQKYVRQGTADAFCTVPTSERRKYTEISTEPVIMPVFTLFAMAKNPRIEEIRTVRTIKGLKNFSLGHFLGAGWAKKNLAGLNVDWGSTLESTLKKLAHGRFDIHPGVSQVVRFEIGRLGLKDDIIEMPNVIDRKSFNLCVGKKSPYANILPRFDEMLRKMRKNGVLKKIYGKYE